MNYDHSGRLETIYKTLNDQTDKKTLIVSNTYDELGQLKTKALGKKYSSTEPLEKLDYTYNVRGWLKGINAAFSHPELNAGSAVDRWFGMELNYDYGSGFSNNKDRNQYNGNISSVTWRSKGDGMQRAYGYTYDQANRITGADFSERSASSNSYNDNANVNFDMVMNDGGTHSGYDANGNIKGMTQWGLKLNSSSVIDKLTYDYYENSNKLKTVSEPVNTLPNNLGDFTDNNTTGNDYGYDVNGNMITDLNKRIKGAYTPDLDQTSGAITYNHLNLPWKIMMKKDDNSTSKGYILYKYDAGGNKLSKTVHEEGVTQDKTTDYVSGMVYEQDMLQFIPHEEGRARIKNTDGVVAHSYDYFIKDHLSNVRMVLTDEIQQDIYPAATLEGDMNTSGIPNAINVEQNYYNITTANVANKSEATGIPDYVNNNVVPSNNPSSQTTANSQKLYKLEATGSGGVTGLGITLKVMSGDKIDIFGKSYYFQNSSTVVPAIPALDILSGLLGAPSGAAAGKGATATGLNAISSIAGPLNAFLGSTNRPANTAPKAYINYILFDENFNFVSADFSRVGSLNTVKNHYDDPKMQNIPVSKNGYLYVYYSNESRVKVFFDNLQVIHTKGALLEETHYYPFGLTMVGISSKAAGNVVNRNKFNAGNEFQNGEFSDGSGLELYDAANRMYDPQLGRFGQIDKLADVLFNYSPYLFGNDNPILYNDPLGLLSTPGNPEVLQEAFVTAKRNNPLNNLSYASTTAWVDKQRGNGFNNNQINTFLDRQHLNNQARDKFNDAMSQAATKIRAAEDEYWKEQAEIAKMIGLSLVPVGEIGGLVGVVGTRVINIIAKSGGEVLGEAIIQGTNVVYQGVDASGVVRYVGITERAPAIRFAEHASSLGTGKENLVYRVVDGATGLSRTQARVVEQRFINQFGLGNNQGMLLNKINSIAPKNWVQYGIK